MKTAIIGLGSRGRLYAGLAQKHIRDFTLAAVCDISAEKRELAKNEYGIPQELVFSNSESFFARGKIADVLIIASADKAHYEDALRALDLGYDILLEKPISPLENECVEIVNKAKAAGRKVVVCHVLRYTPFYRKIKELIDSDKIGEIAALTQTENVGYWHQAHSFVRGNWSNSNDSSPMILQKCCHDTDIIRWLVGKKCNAVSSFGGLYHFKKENAPKNSADRCVDCRVRCIYNAVDFYSAHKEWFNMISDADCDVKEYLRTSPYGQCVYKCGNNVVDRQIVNMVFDGGAVAQLTMIAFSADCHRGIKIHGTKGEITGDFEEGIITVREFGQGGTSQTGEIIDIKQTGADLSGHGGGDILLVKDFFATILGNGTGAFDVSESLEGHLIAFAAEKSRLNDGSIEKIRSENGI